MDRRKFLLGLGVDPKAWAAKHGIEPFSRPCEECGTEMVTTIPFALREMRGLIAPRCKCGSNNTPYCVVGFLEDCRS